MKRAQKTIIERNLRVDIRGHHALCEMNFFRMEKLMPGYKSGVGFWFYTMDRISAREGEVKSVAIRILNRAPYTTTVEIQQGAIPQEEENTRHFSYAPTLQVRLYNDVKMAEIVSWNDHRNWLAQYRYPNDRMYHPDEKLALNRFLGEWLAFCRKEARISFENCEQVLACDK